MGDHHNHNNHRHSSDNHQRPHSNDHSYRHQDNQSRHRPQQHQNTHRSPPHMVAQYQRTDMPGPEKPSKFSQLKEKFQERTREKVPTKEQLEELKLRAENAKYNADIKVHNARKAKAEKENPSGWRRLFAATMQQQPQRGGGRVGTRRPSTSRYYGGQGRGPPQMGDSMLIGPGSFSGDSLMFSPEGGHVGDNMLSFQSNGQMIQNDMLSIKSGGNAFTGGAKQGKSRKSESMDTGFGSSAMDMFKF